MVKKEFRKMIFSKYVFNKKQICLIEQLIENSVFIQLMHNQDFLNIYTQLNIKLKIA